MYKGDQRVPGKLVRCRQSCEPSRPQGYYRDDERSLSKIDEAGWLHTGDIGEWTAWGTLRVIDKIKTIFKLSNGDYVDPNRLETVYVQSQYINQVVHDEEYY